MLNSELICNWPENCGTGISSSLNWVLGTDSPFTTSTGPWAAAIPLAPKNSVSP
ncbi:hypothetical protein D3C84_770730 [compost metagenome]